MVKQIKNFFLRNGLVILVGCILTEKAAKTAYNTRGYMAVGGEWLILPIMLLLVEFGREFIETISYWLSEDFDEDLSKYFDEEADD